MFPFHGLTRPKPSSDLVEPFFDIDYIGAGEQHSMELAQNLFVKVSPALRTAGMLVDDIASVAAISRKSFKGS